MDKVSKYTALNKFNQIKQKSNIFVFNYYFYELKNFVYLLSNDKAAIILNHDRNLYRLYFCCSELVEFEKLLIQLPKDKKICLEYLSKEYMDEALFQCISKYLNFDSIFERSRCNICDLKVDETIEFSSSFAELSDLKSIEISLNNTFSHFYAHFPKRSELKSLVQNNQVIVQKNDKTIDSFIIYKINKNNINFDQWVNISGSPFQSVRLINDFYSIIKRGYYNYIYNWVDINHNISVQKFHSFYGFKKDGLRDYYFINDCLRYSIDDHRMGKD